MVVHRHCARTYLLLLLSLSPHLFKLWRCSSRRLKCRRCHRRCWGRHSCSCAARCLSVIIVVHAPHVHGAVASATADAGAVGGGRRAAHRPHVALLGGAQHARHMVRLLATTSQGTRTYSEIATDGDTISNFKDSL